MEKATDGLNRTNQAIQSSAEIINSSASADDIGKIIEKSSTTSPNKRTYSLFNAAIERLAR